MLAAAMMTACTGDVTLDSSTALASFSDDSVFFTATANGGTRGTAVVGSTLPDEATFRVYATQEKGGIKSVFIDNTTGGNTVSYTDGAWRTASTYYWPYNSYQLKFYAVYPATGVPEVTDLLSTPVLNFTGDDAIDGNIDLLTATASDSRNSRKENSNTPVALSFDHALSQVVIKGKLGIDFQERGWQVSVSAIRLCQVNNSGTFNLTTSAFEPLLTHSDPDDQTSPMIPAVLANYDFTMADDEPITIGTTVTDITSETDVTMLMPQVLTPWNAYGEPISATTGCYLEVTLHITDSQGGDILGTAGNYAKTYVPFSANPANAGEPWQAGKCHVYTLNFGTGVGEDGFVINAFSALAAWVSMYGDTEVSVGFFNFLLKLGIDPLQPWNDGGDNQLEAAFYSYLLALGIDPLQPWDTQTGEVELSIGFFDYLMTLGVEPLHAWDSGGDRALDVSFGFSLSISTSITPWQEGGNRSLTVGY